MTLEEDDGDKHSIVVILRQQANGSWRLYNVGTGGNFRDAIGKYFAPVHDHPLISLTGGWSTALHAGTAATEYEFVAHGEIIDNGFDVTHVRLVNEVGQVFEDTVQDGLVLFAGVQEQKVQWPMQAELYNSTGKLVWRETVLDNRMPPWLKPRHP